MSFPDGEGCKRKKYIIITSGHRAQMALRAVPIFDGSSMSFLTNTSQAKTGPHRRAKMTGPSPPRIMRTTAPATQLQTATPACRKTKVGRQLTPQKIGIAWEKVRRVVRDLCRQRGTECLLCFLYGRRIEFQLTANHRTITLDLDDDRIVARIAHKRWAIRIVRIKTGGSGYQLRRKIHTATSMLIELLLEARK